MTRVLLITGARSLADDPAAEAWARGLIAEALAGVDLLIVGDADGPDGWARRAAGGHVPQMRCYLTHGPDAGMISTITVSHDYSAAEWAMTPWARGNDTHPLRRNAAMVRDAAALRDKGHDVRCLALLDGRKPAKPKPGEARPTRGTEHTARLARDAGLTVDAQTWPTKGATT